MLKRLIAFHKFLYITFNYFCRISFRCNTKVDAAFLIKLIGYISTFPHKFEWECLLLLIILAFYLRAIILLLLILIALVHKTS